MRGWTGMEHKTGLEEYSVKKGKKQLRLGYTTGSCAAAAAKGATIMLLGGQNLSEVELLTPKGILLHLKLCEITKETGEDGLYSAVTCAVKKDSGDDPDTTNGVLVFARVEKREVPGFWVDGGDGVGRVTKKGLSQKIGEAAINPVPKAMILKVVEDAANEFQYEGGLKVTIFVPGGAELAKKTFNERLGITGGISILGTTGIVEPMSEKALIDSMYVEMKQQFAQGAEYLVVTPGNYGTEFLQEFSAQRSFPPKPQMKCSNYVGETIDMAVDIGVKGILFVAHIGKFVKVASGIMNTHSHHADGRMETLASNAVRAGCDLTCARQILNAATTDEALDVLAQNRLLEQTMKEITNRIQFYLDHRSYEQILLGAVLFSQEYGYLGETGTVGELIGKLKRQGRKNG